MGKEIRRAPEAAALSADAERSIGAYLARQRELRGISLDDLATLTRIPRRSLERLESGVFDRAPDGFVRGFVRTVAAALGLDPDETVMRLLSEPAAEALDSRHEAAPWRSPAARLALIALAVLAAAGAVAWLARGLESRRSEPRSPGEVLLRPDPIRDLAREAATRPPAPPPAPAADVPAADAPAADAPAANAPAADAPAADAPALAAEPPPAEPPPTEPVPQAEATPEAAAELPPPSAGAPVAPAAPPPAAPDPAAAP